MTRIWWVFAVLVVLAACGSTMPQVTEADAAWAQTRWPQSSATQLATARILYIERCSGCHALVAPAAHAPEKWPAIVQKMGKLAKLTEQESEQIERYVVTAARPERPAQP